MTRKYEYAERTAELKYAKTVALTIRPPAGGSIPRNVGARLLEAVVALQKAGYEVSVR